MEFHRPGEDGSPDSERADEHEVSAAERTRRGDAGKLWAMRRLVAFHRFEQRRQGAQLLFGLLFQALAVRHGVAVDRARRRHGKSRRGGRVLGNPQSEREVQLDQRVPCGFRLSLETGHVTDQAAQALAKPAAFSAPRAILAVLQKAAQNARRDHRREDHAGAPKDRHDRDRAQTRRGEAERAHTAPRVRRMNLDFHGRRRLRRAATRRRRRDPRRRRPWPRWRGDSPRCAARGRCPAPRLGDCRSRGSPGRHRGRRARRRPLR